VALDNAFYDDTLASVYDQMYPLDGDTVQAIDFIGELAPPGGRILALGVGTGRIAVPLAELGYDVHGIEGSTAMLTKLKERDPGGKVTTHLGDFTETTTGEQFDVVTLVLNTFYVAITKEQQLSCLRNARGQLRGGGKLIIEAFDPAPYHDMKKPEVSVRHLSERAIMLDTLTVDRSKQLMVATHTILSAGSPETKRHVIRYAFPAEIDLLAQLAGLRLAGRWAGWTKLPYTSASLRHVSVYEPDQDV
jgi:SAM-dependent methyltransferase